MRYIQNARKPKGLGGRLFIKRMDKHHDSLMEWCFSLLEPGTDWSCLDVGCGGGMAVKRMLALCPDGKVTGLDYSETSVSRAKNRNVTAVEEGRCEILLGDISKADLPKGAFDLITAFETVYYWPDPVTCFKRISHLLRPGGMFVVCNETDDPRVEWAGDIDGLTIYTGEELEPMLSEAGLDCSVRRKGEWVAVIGTSNPCGPDPSELGPSTSRRQRPRYLRPWRTDGV